MQRKPAERLLEKVAIVTGGGSDRSGAGIGSAIAIEFARHGSSVGVMDRDQHRADATVAAIHSESGTARCLVGDVTVDEHCRQVVAETLDTFGRLDILVNNVGITGRGGGLAMFDETEWDRVLAVNLKGAVLMARHASPALAASHGTIVNISSVSGIRASGGLAYGPSKAGLVGLTRDLAVMLGRDGIRVNAIAPGHLATPMATDGMSDDARRVRRSVAPLGVEGTAWDVAAAAVFLSSDDARFVTGVCLPVDGGVTAVSALTAHRLIIEEDER
jgi:NAD(P)-dependent dehydrogenase (short-subunit alcohol dehydrogenase family)